MISKKIKKYFPVLKWLAAYKMEFFRVDVLSGIVLVALIIPESMAYAEIAGVPPEFGFYASFAALIGYFIFGTSRHMVVSITSTTAILSATVVYSLTAHDPSKFIPLSIGLALLVGVIFLIFGLLKLGLISRFFSTSVITGFIFGLAIIIIIHQIPKLLGLHAEGENPLIILENIIAEINNLNPWSFFIGLTSLALLFLLNKVFPKIPTAIIILFYSGILAWALNLSEKGVTVVGTLSANLPDFGLPALNLGDYYGLIPGAFAIFLVAYAESISVAREYAAKHSYKLRPDQEMIAIGASNIFSGLMQGVTVDASLSRTAANESTGAKTLISTAVSAILLIVCLFLFSDLFYYLPQAALAAIIIHGVYKLIKIRELRKYYRLSKEDFWVALIALLGVITLGIIIGITIAVVVSVIYVIYRSSKPNISVMGASKDMKIFQAVDVQEGFKEIPGLVILRLNTALFFANAMFLMKKFKKITRATNGQLKVLILDLEATNELDISGIDALYNIYNEGKHHKIEIWLTGAKYKVRKTIRKSKLKSCYGKSTIYPSIRIAVREYHKKLSRIIKKNGSKEKNKKHKKIDQKKKNTKK